MIKVRTAKEKDIDKIMDLLIQVNMVHKNIRPDLFKGPVTKYKRDELLKLLNDKDALILVSVDDDDSVLGHAFCFIKETKSDNLLMDNKSIYIDDICVDENKRKMSVGKELFSFIKNYAKENGFYNITLNVWEGNDNAKRFYESVGMKPFKTGMELIL